jgi:tetratricopeptide (TPR) repeat protein
VQKAIALFEQIVEKRKVKLGSDHPDTLNSMNNLALAYQEAGKHDQAERLLRDWLQRQRKKNEPESATTAATLANLGLTLLKQQKYSEAEPLLRECLAIREQKLPDHWRHFNTQSLLGGALLGQQQYAAAEPLLLQGYQGMKQRETQIPHYGKVSLLEAVERLVQLYEATKQPEKARAWRAKRPPENAPGRSK